MEECCCLLFNEAKLFAVGYTVEEIASLMSDETLMLVNYEEGQTLNDITTLAVDSLNSYSLVVVSHSQGNLFANLLHQKLRANPTLVNRMDYYGNLGVGSAANVVEASKSSYITGSTDLVIGALRRAFSVLPANVTYSVSFDDLLQHGFTEVYTNPGLSALFQEQTAEQLFFEKLSNVASLVVDHKCPNGEITYPTLTPDENAGGFISKSSEKTENVYLFDGAAVCDLSTIASNGSGGIMIRGADTIIENSKVENNGSDDLEIVNVKTWKLNYVETESPLLGRIENSNIVNSSMRDAQVFNSEFIQNSTVESSYVANSYLDGANLLYNSYSNATITHGWK